MSRQLDNIGSGYAGAFWVNNPRKKRTCSIATTYAGQDDSLQHADAFESYLAQLEDYDESFYLTKFIFGLCPAILTEVFVQRPATLLEAKRIAEELELTQMMVKMHQTSVKKKTTKTAQHRGTQEGDLKGCISHFS